MPPAHDAPHCMARKAAMKRHREEVEVAALVLADLVGLNALFALGLTIRHWAEIA